MKRLLPIVISIISLLFGCKADKSGLPVPTNNTTLDGTWYLIAESINGTIQGIATAPVTLASFTTKDFYKFNADFTVNISSSLTNTTSTSYYSYISTVNGQTLTIGGSDSENFTTFVVNKLSSDSLLLYNSVSQTLSDVTVVTNTSYTYTH